MSPQVDRLWATRPGSALAWPNGPGQNPSRPRRRPRRRGARPTAPGARAARLGPIFAARAARVLTVGGRRRRRNRQRRGWR
jgi:hypothetical protein